METIDKINAINFLEELREKRIISFYESDDYKHVRKTDLSMIEFDEIYDYIETDGQYNYYNVNEFEEAIIKDDGDYRLVFFYNA